MKNKSLFPALALFFILVFSACQALGLGEPTPTPLPPTPTALPPSELTICLGYEPDSLYPYALSSQAARDVLQAIYDGPIDIIDGQAQPVILEAIPVISSTPVDVRAGDQVMDTYGQLIALQAGAQVFPAGCASADCAIQWDGSSPLQMEQPSAVFRLLPGLTWSDGEPLSASDSLYSFRLASDTATPNDKRQVWESAAYNVLDESSVEWQGRPGLVAESAAPYFWMPLPEHAWGDLSAQELLTAEASARMPLGWGPYVLQEWRPGESIRLVKNPNYFRAGEGLPKYDFVNFRFVSASSGGDVLDGRCDIISPTALGLQQVMDLNPGLAEKGYSLFNNPNTQLEFLAFGITPASYDDFYYPFGADRPDIFGDANIRKAFALCIDRQAIVNGFAAGLMKVSDSYLADAHPLRSGLGLDSYAYDPAQGKALLGQAGWQDYDQNPATPLSMVAANTRVPVGTNFSVSLSTSEAALRRSIAEKVKTDLAQCGIEVTINAQPLSSLYQPAPQGAVFGRAFDLALLSIQYPHEPRCEMFSTSEMPSAGNQWLGTLTGGSNFMGYSSNEYDAACQAARIAGADKAVYNASSQHALQVLARDLPIIPLLQHADFTIYKNTLCLPGTLNSMQKILSSIENLQPNSVCE